MRRTTISQANRSYSGRQTQAIKPAKPVDARPIRDQVYLQQTVERLHAYLNDWQFDGPSEKYLMNGLSLKQIIDITNFLIEKLDIKVYPITFDIKNQELVFAGFSAIFQILGYPDTNAPKMMELRSCSYPQTYRKFLVFMAWLAELTDYAKQIEPYNEDSSTEQFIKEICCAESISQLLTGPTYLYFFAYLYDYFLQQPDEENLRYSLEMNFNLWAYNAGQNEQSVKGEIAKIYGEIGRLDQSLNTELQLARNELLFLQEMATKHNLDLPGESTIETEPSFELLMHLKQRNLEKLDLVQAYLTNLSQVKYNQEIVYLNAYIAYMDEEVKTLQYKHEELLAELQAVTTQVNSYIVQPLEYEQIEFTNSYLQKYLSEVYKELELMKAQYEDKQMRMQKISKSIQQNSALLGLYPQEITPENLAYRLEDTKAEGKKIQQHLQEVNQYYYTQESKRLQLEQYLGKLQQQADKQSDTLKYYKATLVAKYQQKQQRDEYMQYRYVMLKQEITYLITKKRYLEMDVGELKNQNQICMQYADREAKRATEELEKLSRIVGTLTYQINESRNQARGYLETIRDKIGEAIKAYDEEY